MYVYCWSKQPEAMCVCVCGKCSARMRRASENILAAFPMRLYTRCHRTHTNARTVTHILAQLLIARKIQDSLRINAIHVHIELGME